MTPISTLNYELFIQTTPVALWRALVDSSLTSQYFFGTSIKTTLEPGSPIEYAMPDGSIAVDGEIVACVAGESLSHTWRVRYDESMAEEESHVHWSIVPAGRVTRLLVKHDLSKAPLTSRHVGSNGWSIVLSGLKTLLETGRPLDMGVA